MPSSTGGRIVLPAATKTVLFDDASDGCGIGTYLVAQDLFLIAESRDAVECQAPIAASGGAELTCFCGDTTIMITILYKIPLKFVLSVMENKDLKTKN